MKRSLATAVLVSLFVFTATTTATANTVPAGQWASKFCAALSNFQTSLTSEGTKADAVLSGNMTSLTQAKTTLSAFMGTAVNDADTAITALKHAGTPNAPNGSKIASQFASAFQDARTLFASAKSQAQHLRTKTLTRFEGATKNVTAALNKGGRGLTTKFANIKKLDASGKIAAALHAEPTCAFLQGSFQQSQNATTTVP